MHQIRFKNQTKRAARHKLNPFSADYAYQVVLTAVFGGNRVIEWFHVREDGSATGIQRVKPEAIGWWMERLKRDRWVPGQPQGFVSDYTELICRPTEQVYAQVLKRA